VFGEMAMLLDGHRKADAVSRSDITVFAMFGTRFREMQAALLLVAERLDSLAAERAAALS
jgi:CRP-like cAMP-binding protein